MPRTPGQMRELCAGAQAVYHCVNPPFTTWREVFPEVNRALVAAAGAARAVLVLADAPWMYRRGSGPMTEDLPTRPVSHLGVLRAWFAETLLAAHHRGEVRVVIGRAGELYDPKVESLFGANLFARALSNRVLLWPGNPDLPITPTYIEDFARGLATLAAEPVACGRAWHVPSGPPGREFVGTVCAALGRPTKQFLVSERIGRIAGLASPVARLGAELVYQFEQPFVVDSTRYAKAFDSEPATPYRDGITRTITWYRANAHQFRKRSALPV